jgi:hypothetical protein
MICEYCGKLFSKLKKGRIEHINITQETQKHLFCSIKCKEEWCLHIKKHPIGVMVMWSIGHFNNRFFFVKNFKRVRYPSFIGTEIRYSRFAPSLILCESSIH